MGPINNNWARANPISNIWSSVKRAPVFCTDMTVFSSGASLCEEVHLPATQQAPGIWPSWQSYQAQILETSKILK